MLAPKSDFIGLENIIHLTSGGEPPLLKSHREAFEAYARDKSRGQPGYLAHWDVGDEVRAMLGEMTGMSCDDVALTGSASEGIARVISSIAWQEGDNVVTSAPEYASGRFAFARLKKLGVECRIVEMEEDIVDCQRLVDACDQRTRLVYASQVSYLTGQLLDMPTLSSGLADKGVPLLLDVSHALGVVPVSGREADFMVSCCYKWLLGTQTGILFWNRERQPDFEPIAIGWNSAMGGAAEDEYVLLSDARRAEVGNRNHLDVYLLHQSLTYLQHFGIDAIARHARALGDELLEKLAILGLDITTPVPSLMRAGNICFRYANPQRLMRRAADDGLFIWGDNGRVRISTHLFNDKDDLQALFDRLPIYLREEEC